LVSIVIEFGMKAYGYQRVAEGRAAQLIIKIHCEAKGECKELAD